MADNLHEAPWWPLAQQISERAEAFFGKSLSGVYVHGSAALGGWQPHSDLDVLVVRCVPPADSELQAFADSLLALPHDIPIELSIISEVLAREPAPPFPFDLHLTTGKEVKVVRDSGDSDPDLLLHLAVVRAAGVALRGPSPITLFGPVPRTAILEALAKELGWGLAQAPERYAVLNACRALAYAETGQLLSKVAGANWALAQAKIPEALAQQACRTSIQAPTDRSLQPPSDGSGR